ncbi:MAG: ectonucleotide pyrophosphatase/phosphodiesterase, partial [Acidobacteriota bacterium]|nr:ectonucleotide pyrophosphatase/phosphodiesterase [Acidobacteriota bacterium]
MNINQRRTPARLLTCAFLLLAAASSVLSQVKPITDLRPTVILVSLDGFRYDYLKKYKPTNLNQLARAGVRAKWMVPSFPSKTFPNHYTIATGLYPQNHGIVENNIYDNRFDKIFTLSDREEIQKGRWWLGEPIWVTARKQGQKTGSIFYPGTEAEIGGIRPDYWQPYDKKVPNNERVDTILKWLDLPAAERPTFLALYFSDVDDAGHAHGPSSLETKSAVLAVDSGVARLVVGLNERKIFNRVSLIIVSDHGMTTVNFNNAIILDELFDTKLAERIFWTPEIISIFPKAGREDEIYRTLKSRLPPQARVYRKAELPGRLHYSNSPRIAPLLVLPDEGWILTNRKSFEEMKSKGRMNQLGGGHGYDNRLASMRAIFIAHGDRFKKGRVVAPFENVQVYNIMTKLLGLKQAPNDGDDRAARAVLTER